MDASVVVDASVWVSWFVAWDVNYNASRQWMEHYVAQGGQLVAPAFLLVETAAAISRRTRQPAMARGAVRELYYVPAIRFQSPNPTLFWGEVEIAADLHLRAGDAAYIALARQLNIPLVSWDREQLQKAGNLITTIYTPSNYPF